MSFYPFTYELCLPDGRLIMQVECEIVARARLVDNEVEIIVEAVAMDVQKRSMSAGQLWWNPDCTEWIWLGGFLASHVKRTAGPIAWALGEAIAKAAHDDEDFIYSVCHGEDVWPKPEEGAVNAIGGFTR